MKRILLAFFILVSMSSLAQVNVVGYIQTNGVASYPTHIDSMGKGGYMVAKDITERDAIPCLRRKYGMAVYVQSLQKLYILKNNACTNTWVEFSGGGLSDTVFTQSPIMSRTNGDSNIIYFNEDTANVWRGGGTASTVFQNEIHVSKDGSNTTGDGTLLKPFLTITQGLTIVAGTRKTIVLHPGSYTESPNITVQYTVITTFALLGGNTEIVGTVSTSTACTISGVKMTNLTITAPTGTGNVNILNCDISGTLTKSSTGDYTLIRFCDIATTSITGSGLVAIFGGNPRFVTINNAAANVIVKNAVAVAPVLIAGNANFVDCIIPAIATQWVSGTTYAASTATTTVLVYNSGFTYSRRVAGAGTTAPASDTANWLLQPTLNGIDTRNAVTTAPNTVVTIANCQIIVPSFNNVARVSLAGFYSIINTVYDKTLSNFSGTSTNSIVYSQFMNADNVAINTTSSAYKLDVNGQGKINNIFFIDGTYGGNRIFGGKLMEYQTNDSVKQHLFTNEVGSDSSAFGTFGGANAYLVKMKAFKPGQIGEIGTAILRLNGDEDVEKFTFLTNGDMISKNLATGSGNADKMVTVNSNGKLGTQIIPSGSGGARVVDTKAADYTIPTAVTGTDYVYLMSNTTAATITLPSPSGNTSLYSIKRIGLGTVTIAVPIGSGQTIDNTPVSININVRYASLNLISDGANWFIL